MNEHDPESPRLRASILVVDDEAENRELLELMLVQEGLSVVTAAGGEEALAIVARAPPDLILLDIMMPDLDGYEVARRIKGDPATRNIPIVMVTALVDREAGIRGLDAGAEDFLVKPASRAELYLRVRNLLRLKAHGDHQDRYSQKLETEIGSRTADLVESERLYRSTFDAAPVGIVHVGLDGRWLRANKHLCNLLGYTQDELRSYDIQDLVQSHRDPGEAIAFEQMIAGQRIGLVLDEKQYRRRDGAAMWTRINVSVHRDGDGRPVHFIKVIEDITERRLLEAQIRQAGKMDAVGRLASGIAHDFNNLLSVILSYSELLAEDLKAGDPMRADLEEIRDAGLRAVELTRQLLAFSRQQVLQPKVVDLSDVVRGMSKLLGRLIGEDVDLIFPEPIGLSPVLVDPGQIEQVIMNLAINARDAMPGGGKLLIEMTNVVLDAAFASEHESVNPGRHVMLSVTDSGTGMDPATQARIFEPFFTTKGAGQGTGLGLATVFGIVRQSGGTIWVDSAEGRGTKFRIYFPVATRATPPGGLSIPVRHRAVRGHETILLVEDEERVRTLACAILRKFGYDVLEAQSGGDAFLLCEQHAAPIHLLLTDVVMPRMSGRQLAERLLAVRPSLKVLYMSGHTDDAVVRHGILEDTIAFIQKPITPDALAAKVRETLDAVATDG